MKPQYNSLRNIKRDNSQDIQNFQNQISFFEGTRKPRNINNERNRKSFHTYGGSATVLNNRLKNENLS